MIPVQDGSTPGGGARVARAVRLGLTSLAAAGLVALAGCGKKSAGGGFKMPPMPVESASVTQAAVADRFEAVGSIEASEQVTIVTEIDARAVKLPFREGQEIRKGGLIAQLDDAELRAEKERAEALRDQSKLKFERTKSIVEQSAGAAQDLDNAAAELKVTEANLALAETRLLKTRIVAPFAGIVGARRVSPGAYLRAGTPITELSQIREIKVNFSAPERHLPDLRRGTEVAVSTTAYPGYELRGQVDSVDPVLDPNLRSANITVRVANPEGKFRPGMSANVSAILSQRDNSMTIPNEAVFVEGEQSFVFVIKADSTVARTPLVLGTRGAESVEVVKGLEPGMRVVRAGHQKLFEGAKVMPVSSASGVAAAGAAAPASGETKDPKKDTAAGTGKAAAKPAQSGVATR